MSDDEEDANIENKKCFLNKAEIAIESARIFLEHQESLEAGLIPLLS